MRYVILAFIMMILAVAVTNLPAANANALDEMLSQPDKTTQQDSLTNDIIRVNYAKKDARLAMLMSAVVPGAGQFYANKSALTTYIFPVIELAVIGGIVYYNSQGNSKTKDYKKYATETIDQDLVSFTDPNQIIHHYTGPRYNRDFQTAAQNFLRNAHVNDVYDGDYFILDENNSQHFYEDIGKYDKYIFGWADWYANYADSTMSSWSPDPSTIDYTYFNPRFVFTLNPTTNYFTWIGNSPLSDSTQIYQPFSEFRNTYDSMRQSAEDKYKVANYLSFGIALNHIASAIDAVIVANNVNRLYLSQNKLKFNYYAAVKDGHFTPVVGLNLVF